MRWFGVLLLWPIAEEGSLGKSQQLTLLAVWGKMNPCIQRCSWVSFIWGVKNAPRMPRDKAEDRLKDGH